ncbi:TetR/AcrR family transcriptional regulator [Piscinibacter gummiphilus]|uniref:TetR/AcrR family transcriptional regulator n=1 Tax=Piscinibacter gummiphilus TaxID=946333 RepID=A0ABZ0CRL0_9BURK|nr:TetR/AcrR family transcriptional regulator [Piscinibacter gummiphilus]WOB07621.1 TetR/AcrR family transcriptional regulator [Piscinibacter gummiphilus]
MPAKKTPANARKPAPAEGGMREEQLVTIAASLFAQKGYEGTSLRDIAEQAGITKAALYYWFPEKEALFQRVVAGRMAALVERVTTAVAAVSDPLEKIRVFLLCSAEHIDRDRAGWISSSNTFWSNFDPEQRQAVVPERDRFERLLRQCVSDAVAQGALRDIDPALATRLLLSGVNYLPRWHKPGGPLSAVQVVEQYLDMVLNGLSKR